MTATFVTFIGVMAISNVVKKDAKFSETENRTLSAMPAFSFGSLVSRDYGKGIESYISDQFPWRNIFVTLKGGMDMLSGKDDRNGIFIGENDQLLQDFDRRPEEETEAKIAAINQFESNYSDLNMSFMLVPTATKVLEEELPRNAPVDDEEQYIEDFKVKLTPDIKFIDTYEALNSKDDNYIYYKTDHHWTSRGAYVAYEEMCKTLEIEPIPESNFDIEPVTEEFYGSLSSQIGSSKGKPDSIEVYFPKKDGEIIVNYVDEQKKSPSLYSSEKIDSKDKYQVFTNGNHPHINIKTMGDPSKKLLLIKDSYANSMIPFLVFHYGEIEVVDLRYYTDDLDKLIKSKKITDVLFLYNVNTFNEDDSILNLEM